MDQERQAWTCLATQSRACTQFQNLRHRRSPKRGGHFCFAVILDRTGFFFSYLVAVGVLGGKHVCHVCETLGTMPCSFPPDELIPWHDWSKLYECLYINNPYARKTQLSYGYQANPKLKALLDGGNTATDAVISYNIPTLFRMLRSLRSNGETKAEQPETSSFVNESCCARVYHNLFSVMQQLERISASLFPAYECRFLPYGSAALGLASSRNDYDLLWLVRAKHASIGAPTIAPNQTSSSAYTASPLTGNALRHHLFETLRAYLAQNAVAAVPSTVQYVKFAQIPLLKWVWPRTVSNGTTAEPVDIDLSLCLFPPTKRPLSPKRDATNSSAFQRSEVQQLLGQAFLPELRTQLCGKSSAGIRTLVYVLHAIPRTQHALFRTLLSHLRSWAQTYGVYKHLYGYPGGITYALWLVEAMLLAPTAAPVEVMKVLFSYLSAYLQKGSPSNLTYRISRFPVPSWTVGGKPAAKTPLLRVWTPVAPVTNTTSRVRMTTLARLVYEVTRAYRFLEYLFSSEDASALGFSGRNPCQRFCYELRVRVEDEVRCPKQQQGLLETKLLSLADHLQWSGHVLACIASSPATSSSAPSPDGVACAKLPPIRFGFVNLATSGTKGTDHLPLLWPKLFEHQVCLGVHAVCTMEYWLTSSVVKWVQQLSLQTIAFDAVRFELAWYNAARHCWEPCQTPVLSSGHGPLCILPRIPDNLHWLHPPLLREKHLRKLLSMVSPAFGLTLVHMFRNEIRASSWRDLEEASTLRDWFEAVATDECPQKGTRPDAGRGGMNRRQESKPSMTGRITIRYYTNIGETNDSLQWLRALEMTLHMHGSMKEHLGAFRLLALLRCFTTNIALRFLCYLHRKIAQLETFARKVLSLHILAYGVRLSYDHLANYLDELLPSLWGTLANIVPDQASEQEVAQIIECAWCFGILNLFRFRRYARFFGCFDSLLRQVLHHRPLFGVQEQDTKSNSNAITSLIQHGNITNHDEVDGFRMGRPSKRRRTIPSVPKAQETLCNFLHVYEVTLHAMKHPLCNRPLLHELILFRRDGISTHPSRTQSMIAEQFRLLSKVHTPSFAVFEECVTEEGISIDIQLCFCTGLVLYVEVDGPCHFLRETHHALAKTTWKQDMMHRFRRPLLNISVFVWESLLPSQYLAFLSWQLQPFLRVHRPIY